MFHEYFQQHSQNSVDECYLQQIAEKTYCPRLLIACMLIFSMQHVRVLSSVGSKDLVNGFACRLVFIIQQTITMITECLSSVDSKDVLQLWVFRACYLQQIAEYNVPCYLQQIAEYSVPCYLNVLVIFMRVSTAYNWLNLNFFRSLNSHYHIRTQHEKCI